MRIMGLDVGSKTVGLQVVTLGFTAQVLEIIQIDETKRIWLRTVSRISGSIKVDRFVVGTTKT